MYQKFVAHQMPKGIVNIFEVIEVQEQHSQLRVVALCHADGVADTVVQQHPIG